MRCFGSAGPQAAAHPASRRIATPRLIPISSLPKLMRPMEQGTVQPVVVVTTQLRDYLADTYGETARALANQSLAAGRLKCVARPKTFRIARLQRRHRSRLREAH